MPQNNPFESVAPEGKGRISLGQRFLGIRQARIESRERALAGRRTELAYSHQLRKIAEQIGRRVRSAAPDGVLSSADATKLIAALNRYADVLWPWAESVANRMIAEVSRRDAAAWEEHGKAIGRALRREILSAPTGATMRQTLALQAEKITSIPREAAERLYTLTTEGMLKGTRAREIAREIMRSGEVSASHANMLARTGVSSTATALTKARAEHIGSAYFVWRTSKDGAVRPSHRRMEGKMLRWDDPPEIDGYRGLPGEFANCRCFCEPLVPNRLTAGRIQAVKPN
jgi:SPP1 gp7 family putative phage head morphogenesis protein